ncbi:MAG: 2-oxo acid dehydrogenase subunit E2 [Chloroflexota bacterium]
MAVEILLPRLGWDMTEGIFGEWLKEDRASVQPGDLLFTVEGDKATQEVESMDTGILHIDPNGPQMGNTVAVGTLLGYIAHPSERVNFPTPTANIETQSKHSLENLALGPRGFPAYSARISSGDSRKFALPRARRVAAELNIDWTQLEGSGQTGRIVERDVRAAIERQSEAILAPTVPTQDESRVKTTPIAMRMAAEAGIDLMELAAQKPGQRIKREDVEQAIAVRDAAVGDIAVSDTAEAPAADSDEERLPITNIRRLIAQRMHHSVQTTASVTLTTEADATELVALRQQLKTTYEPRGLVVPSYNDLLIRLVAVALQEHTLLNAVWDEEHIVIQKAIHIGLAVDTEAGLLVPVVRDAQTKSVRKIATETATLIKQTQSQTIRPHDLQGGTFTITNLGMYNIDAFTPIINLPQCAILGVGRIVEKPAVHNGGIVPRHMMTLSLTFDHRVIDGGPAARGLDCIREFVEAPFLWLI